MVEEDVLLHALGAQRAEPRRITRSRRPPPCRRPAQRRDGRSTWRQSRSRTGARFAAPPPRASFPRRRSASAGSAERSFGAQASGEPSTPGTILFRPCASSVRCRRRGRGRGGSGRRARPGPWPGSARRTLGTEALGELGPGGELARPPGHAPVGLAVDVRQVGADAEHRLDGHRARDHVARAAPRGAPDLLGGLEEVADQVVVPARLLLRPALVDAAPVHRGPAVDLVEQLGLQDPLLLLRPAAEAVDLVAQRAVVRAVETLDDLGRELLVRRRPRHALVEVDEVALVDARRRRVDDDEHLGREVLALAVEDDARHVHGLRLGGALLHVEVERGETVLSVDDQVLPAGLLEVPHVVEGPDGREGELVGREQQDGARYGRLAHRGVVEVANRGDLAARHLALERGVGVLDLGDEAGDLVVAVDLVGREALLALGVEARDEADAVEQVLCSVGREVEDAVLLPYLRGEHGPRG